MKGFRLPLLLALAAATLTGPARGADAAPPPTLSVAAAANLVYALDGLNAEFRKANPDLVVTSATGASGSLVAQIRNGAPYDVFLSADATFPQVLIKAGQADPKSLTTFALGRLVVWTTKPGVDVTDIAAAVRSPAVVKIAIANSSTAPFGRASREALEKLGAWDAAQPKLVTGENISQASQFVETGNADIGFVALSIVISPKLKDKGRWTEVPPGLYGSLEQCAVVTAHGAANPAAAAYLAFLQGPVAREILRSFGYGIPSAK